MRIFEKARTTAVLAFFAMVLVQVFGHALGVHRSILNSIGVLLGLGIGISFVIFQRSRKRHVERHVD